MENNKMWLGITIGVFISLVIGLTGFIVYDKILNDDNGGQQVDNNNNVSDNGNQEGYTSKFYSVDVNSQIVSSAMSLVLNKNNSSLSSNCSFQYYVYEKYMDGSFNGKITMNDLNSNEKLQLIYENISSSNKPNSFESGKSYYIDSNVFNATAKKVFGDNYIIPEEGYSGCSIQIKFDNNQDKYKIDEALAGDESIVTSNNSYTSAKRNNDTLIIVEKVKFSYPDSVTEEYKQKYSNSLTLEYTFKKDSNNNFYFYSIESK